MAIQRNEVAEPQCDHLDYSIDSDLFSLERWGETINWDIILKQVEKTRQASQMIDISIYPSGLFFAAIDLLEANLLMVDDLFFYITGMRISGPKLGVEDIYKVLGFWNMDCYKVLKQIRKELNKTRFILTDCLKNESIWEITLRVGEMNAQIKNLTRLDSKLLLFDEQAYAYACAHFVVDQIDKESFANQLVNILELINRFDDCFSCIYRFNIEFPKLLALFRQSEIAQRDYLEPWRRDLCGTRDSLITKMEKDPFLGPWVYKYAHLPKGESLLYSYLYNYDISTEEEEECYNTDNWLSILTVAAILQEYDELHGATSPTVAAADKHDDTALVVKLSLCFINEEVARKFLTAVRDMDDDLTIALVQSYQNQKLCTDTTIRLWRMLKDAGLYKASFSNWNKHMNKGYHKP